PVVMISGTTAVDDAIRSFRHGAVQFLRKPFGLAALEASLAEAACIGTARACELERQQRANQIRLSPREHEVLAGLAEGRQSKHIAHGLGISVRTVDMHRANILMKLSAQNVAQAISIARELDLLA